MADHGETLAKDRLCERPLAEDLAGGGLQFADGGFAVEAGAFEESAVRQLQALRVGVGVVRADG